MADSVIDTKYLILYDRWPGVAHVQDEAPPGGFTGSATHNVATAAATIGSKICVPNASDLAGWSTFIYLQYEGTGAPTSAAKQVAVPDATTEQFIVTNDQDSCVLKTGGLLGAVMLSVMTDAYYGWFWCGGTCPVDWVPALDGDILTDNTVTNGLFMWSDLADNDSIGIALLTGVLAPAGYSLAADD